MSTDLGWEEAVHATLQEVILPECFEIKSCPPREAIRRACLNWDYASISGLKVVPSYVTSANKACYLQGERRKKSTFGNKQGR